MDPKLRPITWIGDSLKELKSMPDEVQDAIGSELHLVQAGLMPPHGKPLKGIGSGVLEIRNRFDGNTYRAVCAVQISREIYVLHAFQKKSKHGIATPQSDMDLIKKRYKAASDIEKEKKNDKEKSDKKWH